MVSPRPAAHGTDAAAGTLVPAGLGADGAADHRIRWRPRVWLRRYLPAELAAVVGAVVPAMLVAGWHQPALTALAALIGESIAFYAVIVVADLRAAEKRDLAAVRALGRHWLIEFGPAEALDTLTRPLALFVAISLIDDAAIGSFVGKIVADVAFYVVAVIGFEIARGRRRVRRPDDRPPEIPRQRSRAGAGEESR